MKTHKPLPKTCALILILFLQCFFLSSAFDTPKSVYAQSFDLSISPPLSHIQIKPNTSIIQAFTLTNHSSSPQTLIASLVPFTPSQKDGFPNLQLDSKPAYLQHFNLANSKIRLDQPFSLAANSSDQLVLSLKFPPDTPPQDYYLSLVVSQTTPQSDQQSGAYLSGAISANLLISLTANENPPASISLSDLEVSPVLFQLGPYRILDTLSPITFSITATNHSPHLTTTKGSFNLSHNLRPRHQAGLKPLYLLAYSSRYLQASDSAGFIYHPHPLDLGVLQAEFKIDQSTTPARLSVNLIVVPVKILLGLLLAITLLAFILNPKSRLPKN